MILHTKTKDPRGVTAKLLDRSFHLDAGYIPAESPDKPLAEEEAVTLAAAPAPAAAVGARPLAPANLLIRVLAGLQAGVTGGMVMLLYFSASSILQRQHWWSMQNLLGSAIYGNAALWKGLGKATLAGASMQIVLAALSGILFAVLISHLPAPRPVQLLLALAWGAATYMMLYNFLFFHGAPLIPLYSPRSSPLLAYFLLGISLSRVEPIYQHLSRAKLD